MPLLLMLGMGMTLASSSFVAQEPPLQFESHQALEGWAGSSSGGGSLYDVGAGTPRLYCADRSHTSGVYSSEMAIYVQTNDGYALVLYLPLKVGVQRKAWVEGETFVIEERPMGRAEDRMKMKIPLGMLGGI